MNQAGSQIEVQPGSETLLIVDDEESVLFGIAFFLKKLGYTVLSAENGNTGIDLFQQHPERIDLVVLDLNMPGMSGREVFDALLQMDPTCRILLISGYDPDEQVDTMLRRGAEGFLQKPFRTQELSRLIRSILDE